MTDKLVNVNSRELVTVLNPGLRTLGRFAMIPKKDSDAETDLERDSFWTYYLNEPQYVEEPPEGRKLNKSMLEWVSQGELFKKSKIQTAGRMIVSCKSAEYLTEFLLNDPEVKKAMQKQKEAEELEKQAQEEAAAARLAWRRNDSKGAAQHEAKASALQQQAQQQSNQAQSMFDQFKGSSNAQGLRAQATQQAQQNAQDTQDAMAAWGMEDGQMTDIPMEQIQQIMNDMNRRFLSDLAQKMGRAKGVALKAHKPNSTHNIVITDAGYTKKILDAFPTQKLLLTDDTISPELHNKTLAEFGEHGVLGMVKSSETTESGTLVFLVDGSGSMHDQRHALAKALCLGIGRAAQENGQKWFGSVFGSGNEISKWVGSESAPKDVMEFATFMFNGGTDFNMAVAEGLKFVSGLENPNEADIIMITDGECGISDETTRTLKDMKKRFGVRLMALLVDSGYGSLNSIADYSANVNSNEDIAKAAEGLSQALWKED